ncbi:MAG: palindromic element RPE1 domain-containing protein [Holosporales bacterium]|nr:palindromic element RPE1 domain-containing protein [Holosporales bacterium]
MARGRAVLNGPLSKPSKSEFWEGDAEHRSGAYLDVREHSSTGSTYPKTDFEEFGKRSNEYPVTKRAESRSLGAQKRSVLMVRVHSSAEAQCTYGT